MRSSMPTPQWEPEISLKLIISWKLKHNLRMVWRVSKGRCVFCVSPITALKGLKKKREQAFGMTLVTKTSRTPTMKQKCSAEVPHRFMLMTFKYLWRMVQLQAVTIGHNTLTNQVTNLIPISAVWVMQKNPPSPTTSLTLHIQWGRFVLSPIPYVEDDPLSTVRDDNCYYVFAATSIPANGLLRTQS